VKAVAIGLALVAIYAAASAGPVARMLLVFAATIIGAVVSFAAIGAALIGRDR
jgi:hypothetical protein